MSEIVKDRSRTVDPISVAVLGSFTLTPLCRALKRKGKDLSIPVTVYEAPYGQYREEILNSGSGLYKASPEACILALDTQSVLGDLYYTPLAVSSDKRKGLVERFLDEIRSLVKVFRDNSNGLLLINNLLRPFRTTMGNSDPSAGFGVHEMIDEINLGLVRSAQEVSGVYVVDFDGFMGLHGKREACSEKFRFLGRLLIAEHLLPNLSDLYFTYFRAIRGLNRKCLVVDLDNTLWGGIVGEDGFEGIKLGDTPPGNVYQEFQKAILGIGQRGIALAINSRNNPEDALKVIREHPGMILREADFASIRINWEHKVTNMVAIAEEMNIGLDSLVFFDDEPANRSLMKEALPEVLTIDVPEDPSLYTRTILEFTGFDALTLTTEDLKRKDLYYQERQRKELSREFTDLSAYFKSLDMKVAVREVDDFTIPRAAQLTQRTNQFNMTTKRYTESDIRRFRDSKDSLVLSVDLKDRFGESDGVGLVIVSRADSMAWEIDTFLMSCRVLGRGVEEAFIADLAERARNAGAKTLHGKVVFTKKNIPARDFYRKCGFREEQTTEDASSWALDLAQSDLKAPEWVTLSSES